MRPGRVGEDCLDRRAAGELIPVAAAIAAVIDWWLNSLFEEAWYVNPASIFKFLEELKQQKRTKLSNSPIIRCENNQYKCL